MDKPSLVLNDSKVTIMTRWSKSDVKCHFYGYFTSNEIYTFRLVCLTAYGQQLDDSMNGVSEAELTLFRYQNKQL